MGDFNFGDGEPENKQMALKYIDVWQQLEANDLGYTWDIDQSHLARKNSFLLEKSRRLDKVYSRGNMLTPLTIEIVGKQSFVTPTGKILYPSDHFGLSVIFDIKEDVK